MSHIEQTLFIIKPDGVERGVIGKIITQLEERGLKIVGMKMTTADKQLADKHYGGLGERLNKRGLEGDKIQAQMIDFLLSGPVVAMVIEGVKAVEYVKRLAGATYPNESEFGTIRGMFAHVTRLHANESDRAVRNLVHASDPAEHPEREIALWFTPEELVDYQTVHQSNTW
jgi:nucleoside-diphosphate kinase